MKLTMIATVLLVSAYSPMGLGPATAGSGSNITALPAASRKSVSTNPVPRAPTFHEVATLPRGWFLIHRNAWSPTGKLLAALGPDGACYAIPVDEKRGRAPRRLLENATVNAEWSASGSLLAIFTRPTPPIEHYESIVAVSAEDGTRDTIEPARPRGIFRWRRDGTPLVWPSHESSPQRLRKRAGAGQVSPPSNAQTFLATLIVPGERGSRVLCISPEVDAPPTDITGKIVHVPSRIIVRAKFPKSERFLLNVAFDAMGLRTQIRGAEGALLSEITSRGTAGGFTGTTVTSDDLYVLGHRDVEENGQVVSSALVVFDTVRGAQADVTGAPDAANPQAAPIGNLIAFDDPVNGGIHVGWIDF